MRSTENQIESVVKTILLGKSGKTIRDTSTMGDFVIRVRFD